ncbi:hypothetical protein niasHT_002162 [Heterodera trifolii]|uniref:Ribonuclease H1 N-terminal domain-containing protein n=1 Tax=Heterodera trifolii TaxID=157864 RepID=A0ABD2M254_9BILA
MSDHQPLAPSTPSVFYAVAWGHQRGVFGSYKEAQAATKGFPSPTMKKFKNREEAEGFVNRSKPESTSMSVDDSFTKFFAVARGRVVGIFKDIETVKKNTKGYPSAMHKKFDTLDEAKHYLEKYYEGKADEKKSPRKSRTSTDAKMKEEKSKQTTDEETDEATAEKESDEQTKGEDETGAKPVARKRTYGTKVNDEHDGDEETKLGSSEGHKALREEDIPRGEENADAEMREGDEASRTEGQPKKEGESVESETTADHDDEHKIAKVAAKAEEKMEQGGEEEEQKKAETTEDEGVAKKAKLDDTNSTEQK